MKLSDMREILARRELQLTKSLGQNFLHDENQLRKIVDAAELSKSDNVLEIGPGLGPLTELLLEQAGEVLAIEKDARLVEILRERFFNPQSEIAHRQLIQADALRFLQEEPRDWSSWKLVANLPYSVASPILVELAAGDRAPKKIVVTLQFEVAQRLMAEQDTDAYGILTLLVQLDFLPRGLFKIPPGSFFPEPDVDSACVILDRREQPLLPESLRANFVRIVKRAFSQRRKMMMKLLKFDWPAEKLSAAFDALQISPKERAEKLSLDQFVALTKKLGENP
ncbi:MAG TPA: 16S rRNA (adenine(1518)-N(6)/adenine(1519)-N(6))-dimethyltransferase RsmA [Verrucomicrobiae bacterium]|nr:16S rRNA (adenine(1518)-N(6)/adenine(1519)-N(6))-dimethyltransferase RsmA [Verrucomicrobiae bacterium]